jgi:hypothetical protein
MSYNVGDKVTNQTAFTSPIGCYFAAGTVFTVEVVGEVNTRCRADRCGSVVWVTGGAFVSASREDLEDLARRRTRIEADRIAALPAWMR